MIVVDNNYYCYKYTTQNSASSIYILLYFIDLCIIVWTSEGSSVLYERRKIDTLFVILENQRRPSHVGGGSNEELDWILFLHKYKSIVAITHFLHKSQTSDLDHSSGTIFINCHLSILYMHIYAYTIYAFGVSCELVIR